MSTEPGDIFTYMYNHGLGCKLASFYVAWASVLESHGNTKKADAVFEMGMKSAAEPQDLLHRRHRLGLAFYVEFCLNLRKSLHQMLCLFLLSTTLLST